MDWQRLFDTFGVPTVALIGMALAIYWVARFTAKELIIPLRERLITRIFNFFDRLDHTIDRMDTRDVQLDSKARRILEGVTRVENDLKGVKEICEKLEDWWEDSPTATPPAPSPRRNRPNRPPSAAGPNSS